MGVLVLAGTKKGLFLLRGDDDRQRFEVDDPLLSGWDVNHATIDPRDGTLYACANNPAYGATVHRSPDLGQSWERAAIELPEGAPELERTWHVEPGLPESPDEVWLGAAPALLFRSRDGGRSFRVVDGVLNHPTRGRWLPGAGGMCCHSIQVDRAQPGRMWIAISAAGAFRSEDGGETWTPANQGVAADFLPERYPEVGHCVHKLLAHPARPGRLWQQNHCGTYRSDDAGETWERLDGNGLPSDFGFGLALDPTDADAAFVVPIESAENRVTPNGRLGVYRTRDAGATWEEASGGLPEPGWVMVLREGMASDTLDPFGVYVGTQSGAVFARAGTSDWVEAASAVPPVVSVEVASWS
jgi:photosystem II stability/assembly factor-like uncharacterized protein